MKLYALKLPSAKILAVVSIGKNSVRPCASRYSPQKDKIPQLNKGRLDWLFDDGFRRPLAKDQGGKMRKDWICYGAHPTDEYEDWKGYHKIVFLFMFLFFPVAAVGLYYRNDAMQHQRWAKREAFFELERRQKAGLPLVSKNFIDPKRVESILPSDEELGDFNIIV